MHLNTVAYKIVGVDAPLAAFIDGMPVWRTCVHLAKNNRKITQKYDYPADELGYRDAMDTYLDYCDRMENNILVSVWRKQRGR